MQTEWLILADAAQVVGNKLYLLGGGWDILMPQSDFPFQQRCAVAVSFRVPWNETNQRHTFQIEIATEDGQVIGNVEGQFEVGRPPGIRPGQEQRFQLAIDTTLTFEHPGGYAIIARLEGKESARTSFNVIAAER